MSTVSAKSFAIRNERVTSTQKKNPKEFIVIFLALFLVFPSSLPSPLPFSNGVPEKKISIKNRAIINFNDSTVKANETFIQADDSPAWDRESCLSI